RDIVTLGEAHDDIAFIGTQGIAHEAHRVRIPGVAQRFAKLAGDDFRELVLETLAILVGEGQISRIGANPEDLWIDKLDRRSRAFLGKGAGLSRKPEGESGQEGSKLVS